jgi:hypothetical protein
MELYIVKGNFKGERLEKNGPHKHHKIGETFQSNDEKKIEVLVKAGLIVKKEDVDGEMLLSLEKKVAEKKAELQALTEAIVALQKSQKKLSPVQEAQALHANGNKDASKKANK